MKPAKTLLLTVIISAVLLAAVGYVSSRWESYHGFDGMCLDCHLTQPDRNSKKAGTLVKDITVMCATCHEGVQDLSHPVDITPSMDVSPAFPLDWKGHVTCVTCHPVHDEGYGDFHLRVRAKGEGFCVNCHSDIESEMHKVAVGTAHTGKVMVARYVPGQLDVVLDELSIRCLACHDAIFAGEALVENFSFTLGFHDNNEIGVSHPIGVSYTETKRKYMGAYRNIENLPREITLFGGQVGCGSCHNPYSKRHFELVMSNEGSALCLACHVK